MFSKGNTTTKKCIVNASDNQHAIKIAVCRLCRMYPQEDITRVRVAGVYDAQKKTIKKRIGE